MFGFHGADLAGLCQPAPAAAGAGETGTQAAGRRSQLRTALTAGDVRLSWHPPPEISRADGERFYLTAGRAVLAVDWDTHADIPLTTVRVCRGGRHWRNLVHGPRPSLLRRLARALSPRG
jgi:hypothetical protein